MTVLREHELRERHWFEHEPYGAFWERGYRDRHISTMGGPSHEIVELVPALPPHARVLDLGCGEGRNSLYLAGLGFDVTAVDRSSAGIGKLREIAAASGIQLDGHVADIANLNLDEDFDLVMAHGVLYYLSNEEWRDLLGQVKARTRPGGFNAYSVFIFSEEFPKGPEFRSARYTHSFAPDELRTFYADWEVIRADAYVKWDQHPGIPLHCHPVEKVVARKPGAGAAARIDGIPIGDRDMPRDVFDAIEMGLPQDELLARCGVPHYIDRYRADGVQIGSVDATVEGFVLELWYYGRTAIYVVAGHVCGRALLATAPVRIAFEVVPGV